MDINTSYLNQAVSNANSADTELKGAKGRNYSKATDEELMNACKQFEAYFIEQVLKEVDKTIPREEYSDAPTSNLVDYFKGNMIQEMAGTLQEGSGLGLAQQMYEQMKRNYGTVTPESIDSEDK